MTDDELKAIELRLLSALGDDGFDASPSFTLADAVMGERRRAIVADHKALVAEVRRLRALIVEVAPEFEHLMTERDRYDLEACGYPALLEKLKSA